MYATDPDNPIMIRTVVFERLNYLYGKCVFCKNDFPFGRACPSVCTSRRFPETPREREVIRRHVFFARI